jgi:TldD protein
VEPLVVYKVFADGRPDQLVRGVDIVGTPLAALTKIVATGDTLEVFNGYCGAESGYVPVSAASPAILTSELEVQKKQSSTDRPPILPPPAHDIQKSGGLQ